jgi:uncharacterized protein
MQGRNLGLIAAVALALISLPLARGLRMDWQLDRMFASGDPLVDSYHRLQARFGGNEVVLAVYHDEQLWDSSGEGLERLERISDRLENVPGVQGVLSLAELHRLLEKLQSPLGLLRPRNPLPPLLDPDNALAQAFLEVFQGYTHQPGSPIVAVACMLEPITPDRPNHRETIAQLREVLAALEEPARRGVLTGEPVMVTDGFAMVEQDGQRLGIVSTTLLALVLLTVFRSLRWTLIPLVVVHWSILVTQAILAALQLELTMVSSMLTAIITVIGVATTMHVLLRYQRARGAGEEPEQAITSTWRELRAPIAWAIVTDAVGFSSLAIADVGPVRDFGIMMAIGSLTVLLAIGLLVPGLALLGKWDRDPKMPPFDLVLRLSLRRLLTTVLARRAAGLAALVVLAVLGVWGSLRMQVETDFTRNFREDSSLVRGYRLVESELGGAGVWDVMLPAPRDITADYLAQIHQLQGRLRDLQVGTGARPLRLTKVLSIADADQAAQSGTLLSALPVAARLEGMRAALPAFTGALLTPTDHPEPTRWLRIMLRSREQAPAQQKWQLIEAVQREVADFTASPAWQAQFASVNAPAAEVTGYYIMLVRLVSSILSDQWRCFLLATVGIFITMTLATRSPWLGAAALVPNALPIFLVLGGMGWIGMRVNMGAAMIAAVSMGLSIDSSIHYLMHMQRLAARGIPLAKAVRSAQENVGLALVLSTIALIAGFLSLCVSQFVPTIVFGVLVSLTMLGGLIGNLVVLPLLIAPRAQGKKGSAATAGG